MYVAPETLEPLIWFFIWTFSIIETQRSIDVIYSGFVISVPRVPGKSRLTIYTMRTGVKPYHAVSIIYFIRSYGDQKRHCGKDAPESTGIYTT